MKRSRFSGDLETETEERSEGEEKVGGEGSGKEEE